MLQAVVAIIVVVMGGSYIGAGIDQYIRKEGGVLEMLFGLCVILFGAYIFFDTPPYA